MGLTVFSDTWAGRSASFFMLIFCVYLLKFLGIVPVDTVAFFYFIFCLYLFRNLIVGFLCAGLNYRSQGFFVFFVIMSSMIFGLALNYFYASSEISIIKYLFIGSLFFLFYYSPVKKNTGLDVSYYFFILISILIFSMIVYLLIIGSNFKLFFEDEYRDSYLVLSDLLVFAALFFLSDFRRPAVLRWGFFIIFTVAIFVLGSRSAIVFMSASGFAAFCLQIRYVNFITKIANFIILILMQLCIFFLILKNEDFFYRFLSILNLDGDDSVSDRAKLYDEFFDFLSGGLLNFFLGGGVIVEGTYVHSIVSVWQFFGIIPFFMILVLLVSVILKIILRIQMYEKIIPIFLYCLLSLAFTRGVAGVVFPLFVTISLIVIFPSRVNNI